MHTFNTGGGVLIATPTDISRSKPLQIRSFQKCTSTRARHGPACSPGTKETRCATVLSSARRAWFPKLAHDIKHAHACLSAKLRGVPRRLHRRMRADTPRIRCLATSYVGFQPRTIPASKLGPARARRTCDHMASCRYRYASHGHAPCICSACKMLRTSTFSIAALKFPHCWQRPVLRVPGAEPCG